MTQGAEEQVVSGAYCSESDLRIGDTRLPSYMSKEAFIRGAAEEIDIALGSIYVTPIILPNTAEARPARLVLKKINWLLASGRIILDLNAAGESDNQHAYGMGMLKEGLSLLKDYHSKELDLVGAIKIDNGDGQAGNFTGPSIHNEDPVSLVQSFYERGAGTIFTYPPRTQVQPYGYDRKLNP